MLVRNSAMNERPNVAMSNARRRILPLGRCEWPNKTKTLTIQVHQSGPEILTPSAR